MENEIKIPAGADLVHTVHVFDQNGAIFDCSIFTKIVITVYHAGGQIIAKFSLNPSVGYGSIDATNAALGILSIKLLTTHTLSSPKGKLFTETHGQYADPSLPDDNVLDLLTRDNYCCTITDSITGGQILP